MKMKYHGPDKYRTVGFWNYVLTPSCNVKLRVEQGRIFIRHSNGTIDHFKSTPAGLRSLRDKLLRFPLSKDEPDALMEDVARILNGTAAKAMPIVPPRHLVVPPRHIGAKHVKGNSP